MGIKYSFIDNVVYGPEDINDITRSLTGAGIAPFLSKDSYNVSDLNTMTSALVASGVELGGCKCTVEGLGTAEITVTVAQGIIFFESGVRLTVDGDGYIISVSPDTEGVVYAHYSSSLQKADILFGTELPSDGECVELARILTDGTIKDARTYARSRIATLGNNVIYSIPEDKVTVYDSYAVAPSYSDKEKILGEIDLSDVDFSRFNYLIYKYSGWSYDGNVTEMYEKQFDFKSNAEGSFYVRGTLYYVNSLFKIVVTETKFIVVVDNANVFETYASAFVSAIPYFKLV